MPIELVKGYGTTPDKTYGLIWGEKDVANQPHRLFVLADNIHDSRLAPDQMINRFGKGGMAFHMRPKRIIDNTDPKNPIYDVNIIGIPTMPYTEDDPPMSEEILKEAFARIYEKIGANSGPNSQFTELVIPYSKKTKKEPEGHPLFGGYNAPNFRKNLGKIFDAELAKLEEFMKNPKAGLDDPSLDEKYKDAYRKGLVNPQVAVVSAPKAAAAAATEAAPTAAPTETAATKPVPEAVPKKAAPTEAEKKAVAKATGGAAVAAQKEKLEKMMEQMRKDAASITVPKEKRRVDAPAAPTIEMIPDEGPSLEVTRQDQSPEARDESHKESPKESRNESDDVFFKTFDAVFPLKKWTPDQERGDKRTYTNKANADKKVTIQRTPNGASFSSTAAGTDKMIEAAIACADKFGSSARFKLTANSEKQALEMIQKIQDSGGNVNAISEIKYPGKPQGISEHDFIQTLIAKSQGKAAKETSAADKPFTAGKPFTTDKPTDKPMPPAPEFTEGVDGPEAAAPAGGEPAPASPKDDGAEEAPAKAAATPGKAEAGAGGVDENLESDDKEMINEAAKAAALLQALRDAKAAAAAGPAAATPPPATTAAPATAAAPAAKLGAAAAVPAPPPPPLKAAGQAASKANPVGKKKSFPGENIAFEAAKTKTKMTLQEELTAELAARAKKPKL